MGFKKQLFVPSVAIFDKKLNLTRVVDESSLALKDSSMSRPVRAEVDIEFTEQQRADKYLLVATDASKINKVAGTFTGAVGTSDIDYPVVRSLEGKIRIEIPNPKDEKKKKKTDR